MTSDGARGVSEYLRRVLYWVNHQRCVWHVWRLERAVLVWAIYRNFTPRQWRSERKRRYRHPGRSPLEVARASPEGVSYLDALEV